MRVLYSVGSLQCGFSTVWVLYLCVFSTSVGSLQCGFSTCVGSLQCGFSTFLGELSDDSEGTLVGVEEMVMLFLRINT